MKTTRFTQILATAISLTALAATVCAKATGPAGPTTVPPLANASPKTMQVVTTPTPEVAPDRWSDLKDVIFDDREQFFVGLKSLENRVDDQLVELKAKRATMNSSVNTKDWDFAMKEMLEARAYLKSSGEESGKATPETWDQAKDKVGQAWVRTQNAYASVKASTTL